LFCAGRKPLAEKAPELALREEGEVAAVEGEIVDGLFGYDLADGGLVGLQLRGRGGDLDGLGDLTGLKMNRHLQVLGNIDREILLGGLLKATGGDGHGVMADAQRREGELARTVGDAGQRQSDVRVPHRNVRVGHDGTGAVHDGA
jgi:hypothetical protein